MSYDSYSGRQAGGAPPAGSFSSDQDPYSAGASAASGPRKNVAGLIGQRAASQLTEQEAEALYKIRRTASNFRLAGYIIGAMGTALFMRRRKPEMGRIPLFFYSTAGSVGTAFLMTPLGIVAGQRHLKGMQDPQHLAQVLADARAESVERRQQRNGMPPPPMTQSQNMTGGAPPPYGVTSPGSGSPNQPYSSPANYRPDQPYANDAASAGWGNEASGSYNSTGLSPPPQAGQQPQAQQGQQPSRWAQLRGERGAQHSRWDELRQQNAREQMAQQPGQQAQGGQGFGAAGAGGGLPSGDFGAGGGGSRPVLADPTFGKGTEADRAKASREFEASMERERRGLDGAGTTWAR